MEHPVKTLIVEDEMIIVADEGTLQQQIISF